MVSSLISSIKGTLEGVGVDWADVAVGGVTFRASVPASTVERLGPIGNEVVLLTSLQVREDSITLFGFHSQEARLAFEALIGISGVGPRVALSVLSRFSPEALAMAVGSGDTTAFNRVPGVGKKTAGRIVLELKGKLEGEWAVPSMVGGDGEVIEALTSLGYTVSEAREAALSLSPDNSASLEEKVRQALQRLGGG